MSLYSQDKLKLICMLTVHKWKVGLSLFNFLHLSKRLGLLSLQHILWLFSLISQTLSLAIVLLQLLISLEILLAGRWQQKHKLDRSECSSSLFWVSHIYKDIPDTPTYILILNANLVVPALIVNSLPKTCWLLLDTSYQISNLPQN